jgi:hypothetical protein
MNTTELLHEFTRELYKELRVNDFDRARIVANYKSGNSICETYIEKAYIPVCCVVTIQSEKEVRTYIRKNGHNIDLNPISNLDVTKDLVEVCAKTIARRVLQIWNQEVLNTRAMWITSPEIPNWKAIVYSVIDPVAIAKIVNNAMIASPRPKQPECNMRLVMEQGYVTGNGIAPIMSQELYVNFQRFYALCVQSEVLHLMNPDELLLPEAWESRK